jgi:hypothetical protein
VPTVTEPENTNRFAARLPLILILSSIVGCGQTQVAPQNRELILKLATASSLRETARIDRVAEEIDRLSASNELTDQERSAFAKVIELARSGDWDSARNHAYALRDGQIPTQDDLDAVAARRTPPMIKSSNPRDHGGANH